MNIVEPLRDKDDIQAMKDYLSSWNEKYYMLFLLGINTGFRVGDILKLKVKDVQGWHIKVREQKTGKYKSIKMTRPIKNELREFV
ncbi:tyrosine-type recombinase/integrase, partial [Streptococcus pneumoniae]